jgi:hypothetical protein
VISLIAVGSSRVGGGPLPPAGDGRVLRLVMEIEAERSAFPSEGLLAFAPIGMCAWWHREHPLQCGLATFHGFSLAV